MKPAVRVAVTGAAGQVGYALVQRIAAGDLFGSVPVELRLLELPDALKSLDGVAMEMADCASPHLAGIEITSDLAKAFDGVNFAFLVGALPRRVGMARSDLLNVNAAIFAEQGAALAAGAADDLRVVVVGNPVNTNALVAAKHAVGVPPERFTALARLDHNRARAMIARKARRSTSDVTRVSVWGNHSPTQFPDAYHALVCGHPATTWIDEAWIVFNLIPDVARRGTAVLEARGKSSAASAANAAIEHLRDWVFGTPDGDWTSMAVPSDGSYGVPEGLVSSFPCVCRSGRYEIVQGLKLNTLARLSLDASVKELQAEAAAVL